MNAETKKKLDNLSLDKYQKIALQDLSKKDDQKTISTFGWVTKCTPMKNVSFIELTNSFATIKCVFSGSVNLTFSTSLTVWGQVSSKVSGKDRFEFEVQVEKYEIYNGNEAPSFPINKSSDKDSLLSYAHLALRLPERSLFLLARSEMLRCYRDFYHKNEYVEITPPTIVKTQVEGGSTLFKLDYYGTDAYLTQSSQLYLETVVPVAGKCFCIMPSYRAEKSKTSRHLSEYTHVEAELADVGFDGLVNSIEMLVRHVITEFYGKMLSKIEQIYPNFKPFILKPQPFKRIRYQDAIKFLIEKGHLKQDGTPYQMMDDICDASEKFIVSEFGEDQPVFLTHFPIEHKPFYMKCDGPFTESCDLLFPGIGEVAGGSMRCDNYEKLLDGFKRENLPIESYKWYLDMSIYGPSSHGGYGIGFERIMMGLMDYKNVDEATLYPRKITRCFP